MPSICLSSGSQHMTGVEKFHPHNEPIPQFSVVFSERAIDRYNYCFPFTKGMCVTLKNMCAETKPAGSGSATVISSSHLLWPALGGKWQEVCCVRKLGDITFCVCVCTLTQLHRFISPTYNLRYCTSLFHLPAPHCGVSDMSLDYLWGYNGAVKVAGINEAFFLWPRGSDGPLLRLHMLSQPWCCWPQATQGCPTHCLAITQRARGPSEHTSCSIKAQVVSLMWQDDSITYDDFFKGVLVLLLLSPQFLLHVPWCS